MDKQNGIRRIRSSETLHNGFEHAFRALEQIDLEKISTFSDLAQQMARTAFGGRSVGRAVEVLTAMFSDPDCLVLVTLSGAITVAKQGRVIADLAAHDCIGAIVSTGAIVCHGIAEELGNTHFEYDPRWDDEALYAAGYDRVYDTLELERSMDQVEELVFDTLSRRESRTAISSSELCRLLGEELLKRGGYRGFIGEAYQRQIPNLHPRLHGQ